MKKKKRPKKSPKKTAKRDVKRSPAKTKKTAPLPIAPHKTPLSSITPEQAIVGAVLLGKVLDYFSQVSVIALVLEAPLAVGDTIRIKGHTTDLTQKVDSIQVNHESVQSASAGEGIGLKVADKAREGDAVYKI